MTAVHERRRTYYDAAALKDLAENIKAVQVIEPIIVRPKIGGKEAERFEIVAGERCWRAHPTLQRSRYRLTVATLARESSVAHNAIYTNHRMLIDELRHASARSNREAVVGIELSD